MMRKDEILVMQGKGNELEVYNGISTKKMLKLINKKSPFHAQKLRLLDKQTKAIHEEVLKDPDKVIEYFMLAKAKSQTDEFINSELENLSKDEQLKKLEQYHKYDKIGSALLFEHTNFSGQIKFCYPNWPNLKWWPYKFNDKTSSVIGWGGNVLFEHSWYRGRRLTFVAEPGSTIAIPNLKNLGFNDIASSYRSF